MMASSGLMAASASNLGPPPGSAQAASADALLRVLFVGGGLVVVGVLCALLVAALRRRRGDPPARGAWRRRQLLFLAIPAAVVVILFVAGWHRRLDQITPPVRALEIKVIAHAGRWQFIYPNGVSDQVLHLPVGTPMRLRLISVDYVHSLQVPALRLDQVVLPGRYTRTWIAATRAGRFSARCGRAVGGGHPPMHGVVVVHEVGGYDDYLAAKEAEIRPPGALGMTVYVERGCATCHSVDGSANTGPSFQGLYGRREALADGTTIEVDDAYIRESILEPKLKVVTGFQPVMQSYRDILKDSDIDHFIEYLETLK
jgi:cytochrome c oxidase subunit 2